MTEGAAGGGVQVGEHLHLHGLAVGCVPGEGLARRQTVRHHHRHHRMLHLRNIVNDVNGAIGGPCQ